MGESRTVLRNVVRRSLACSVIGAGVGFGLSSFYGLFGLLHDVGLRPSGDAEPWMVAAALAGTGLVLLGWIGTLLRWRWWVVPIYIALGPWLPILFIALLSRGALACLTWASLPGTHAAAAVVIFRRRQG